MAAPKGNSFALNCQTNGRPPIIESKEEMIQKIGEYIDFADNKKGKEGKGIYTLEGAALYLGFASVQSLYDYEKRSEDFSYVINRYRLFLTDWNVQKLYWGGTYMAAQFWLRNHGGYTDETIQKQQQTITNVTPQIIDTGVPLAGNENEIKL